MKPLAGVKILDLTRLLPGPLATLALADLGAEVIKVEDPVLGDYAKHIPPFKNKLGLAFLVLNRNKNFVTLDLKDDEDKRKFYELVKEVDIVVESFRPGTAKALGVDYQTLKELKQDIIYCSLSGYGQSGPNAKKAGHDINYLAESGVLYHQRETTRAPHPVGLQTADVAGGSLPAALGIVSALFNKERRGHGSFIDISITDNLFFLNPVLFSQLQSKEGEPSPATSLLDGGSPCYAVYETSDKRHMALGAMEKKFWVIFCEAIERLDLKERHLPVGAEAKDVRAAIQQEVSKKSQKEWVEIFKDLDACFSPVLSLKEASESKQVTEREILIETTHPSEGAIQSFVLPIKFYP